MFVFSKQSFGSLPVWLKCEAHASAFGIFGSITFARKVVAEVSVPRAMSMSSPAAAIGAANPRVRPRSPEQDVRAPRAASTTQEKPTIEYLDAQMLELKNAMDVDRKEYEERRAKQEQRMDYMMGLVNATKTLQKGNTEAEEFIAAQLAEMSISEGAQELPGGGPREVPGGGGVEPHGEPEQPRGEGLEPATVPLPKSPEVPENFVLRTPSPAGVDTWHASGVSPWPAKPGAAAASSSAGPVPSVEERMAQLELFVSPHQDLWYGGGPPQEPYTTVQDNSQNAQSYEKPENFTEDASGMKALMEIINSLRKEVQELKANADNKQTVMTNAAVAAGWRQGGLAQGDLAQGVRPVPFMDRKLMTKPDR